MIVLVNDKGIAVETTKGTPQYEAIGVTFGTISANDIHSVEVYEHYELDENGAKVLVEGIELMDASGEEFCFPYQAITSINGIVPTSNIHAYKLINTALFGHYSITT